MEGNILATETAPASAPVPATIISGFLGAGKTTLLNHILRAPHGLRIAVLVNDFGAINIDAQLIVELDGDGQTINLSNGCICCTIRGDLLDALLRLLEREDRPEYIIVECSGISDPESLVQTFLMPELRPWISVDSILAVVDAEQLPVYQGASAAIAREQISAADIIVLNKVDLVSPRELAQLKEKWLFPQTRLIETSFAQVPLELVIGVGRYDPDRLHEQSAATDHDHGREEHDHSAVFNSWTWTTSEAVSLNAIKRVVADLPPSIFRCKGILFLAGSADRRGILQVVGSRARLTLGEEWGDQPRRTQVVCIGAPGGLDPDHLKRKFEAAVRGNAETARQIVNAVMEWRRG